MSPRLASNQMPPRWLDRLALVFQRLRPPRRTLPEAERQIRTLRFERLYGFAPDYGYRFHADGDREFASPPSDWADQCTGLIVLHNHPPYREFPLGDPRRDGGSFSALDLRFAVQNAPAEMRVISQRWRHVLRPGPRGWFFRDPDLIAGLYEDAFADVTSEIELGIRRGRLTSGERSDVAHYAVVDLARQLGLEYDREPVIDEPDAR